MVREEHGVPMGARRGSRAGARDRRGSPEARPTRLRRRPAVRAGHADAAAFAHGPQLRHARRGQRDAIALARGGHLRAALAGDVDRSTPAAGGDACT
jgi:hypothetical protein